MNILIVGDTQAGSYEMRAVQLGKIMGARVTTAPNVQDWDWAERIVLIKRAGPKWAPVARMCGVPVIWDALDFWKQPIENVLNALVARGILKTLIAQIRPALVIGATELMAKDAGGLYLPHHGRLGLSPLPARDDVSVVAYDGNERYLDHWRPAIDAACTRRGWKFMVNPPDLSVADILVAFRGGPWDGWPCRAWKSGVKLVNAIMAGRPILTQDTAAVGELKPHGSILEDSRGLDAAFDQWMAYDVRQNVARQALDRAPSFTVEAVARRYQQMIESCTITPQHIR